MKIITSIIIPTYKREKSLLRLLESLTSEVLKETEVIVVEQVFNNQKQIQEFADKKKINLKYVFLSDPSTSKAKNVGASKAHGEFLVFLDDDVIVKPGLVKNYLRNFGDRKVGAIAGRVLTVGQPLEQDKKNVGRITCFGKFTDGFSSIIKQEVDTVIGCNACFRKEVFKRIKGFDEQFTGNAMREESDLSLRVKKLGFKIIFEPKAVVTHLREESGGNRKTEGRINWYYHFFSNEVYFLLKHRSKLLFPFILLSRWNWFIRCMFGFGREVSLRSMITPLKGVLNGIKKYRRVCYAYRR